MKFRLARFVAQILLLLVCTKSFAIDIELYALEHSLTDKAKIEMVEDFMYKQLISFSDVNVIDKRSAQYTGSTTSQNTNIVLIYASIKENPTDFIFTIYAYQPATNKQISVSNTYLSFYKILTDARASLHSIMSQISPNIYPKNITETTVTANNSLTLENISGTWTGEQHINKIVLLRGGRGFVIYKNGATMNINVVIEGNTLFCTQTGKSNASFFPELPREVALVAALNAEPIKWTLNLTDGKTLSGTKESLRISELDTTLSSVEKSVLPVTWTKQ